jgi:hypothetical protein
MQGNFFGLQSAMPQALQYGCHISGLRHYGCRISGQTLHMPNQRCLRHYGCHGGYHISGSQTQRMTYQRCLRHYGCRISGVSDTTDAVLAGLRNNGCRISGVSDRHKQCLTHLCCFDTYANSGIISDSADRASAVILGDIFVALRHR